MPLRWKMVPPFEVLVVSADLASRKHLAGILSTLRVEYLCVSTLRECHDILAQRRIGLVFCDSRVVDGNYQDVLASYPQPDDKPRLVVTSASAEWDEHKEAMRCGAFDLIPAPCRPTDVEWMVIQAKRAERGAERPGPARVEAPEIAKAAGASASGAKSSSSGKK